jgi:radical SAM superfamily enzyme YgiQ (UPF0313 family)
MPFIRPEIIRPPSEHDSYYLPLTSGCSNNACSFCAFSFSNLGVRELDEVKREIDAMSLYMNRHMWVAGVPDIVYAILRDWNGKKVFLQDGDAIVYPYTKLLEAMQYLNQKFPAIERVASYATPQDILRRSLKELKTLKEQKLGILYMGVESGDDEVLQKIQKNANHQQIVEAAKKVKEAGILLSVTVILGLGGVKGSEKHVLETARILTEMDPDFAGALTLTLIPGTRLYEEWKRGELELITPFDSLRELKAIVENSTFSNCFFSSMHASNYFAIRGYMP